MTDMAERLISRDELLELVPFTIQHIYRLERAGKFPKRVRVGEHRVAWVLSEIEGYIAERMALRTPTAAAGEQRSSA